MKNVILTGFAGTGKSVVGQAVATLLGWTFIDTDDVLERLAGKSVEAVFADDGEGAFRALESKALVAVELQYAAGQTRDFDCVPLVLGGFFR